MIHIYGDWYADVYDRGYIVGKIGTTFDKKLGHDRPCIPHPNYFRELSHVVEYAYKEILREQLGRHRKIIDLEDVIMDMRDIERKMEANLTPMKKLADEYVRLLTERAQK